MSLSNIAGKRGLSTPTLSEPLPVSAHRKPENALKSLFHRSGRYPSSRLVRSSRPSRIPATISSVVIEGRGCAARLASLSGIPSAIVGLPADSLSRLNTYSWSPFPHSEREEPAFGGYQWGHFSPEGWSLWSHHKRHAYVSQAHRGS